MKVLLLQPLVPPEVLWGRFVKGQGFIPPIGLLSVAAYVRAKGHSVVIKDTQVERMIAADLEHYLREEPADVIGIPTFTNSVAFSFTTARLCRRVLPSARIVMGGVHATALPERTLAECPEADAVVLSEGEQRLEKLLDYWDKGIGRLEDIDGLAWRRDGRIVVQPVREFIRDVNQLPLPAYDLIDMPRYVPHSTQYRRLPNYPVIIQRGCPFDCSFCGAQTVHGRRIRSKSVDTVISELKLLRAQYGARGVYFQDSTFLINQQFITQLLERMLTEKLNLSWACNSRTSTVDERILALMKKAGCWMIAYGIESANQKSLDLLRKGVTVAQNERAIRLTEKAGMVAFCSYILCIPGETTDDTMNTIRFALRLKSRAALFYLPVPYPGTDLADVCRKDGGMRDDVRWEDYSSADFSNPVYVNPQVGREMMQHLLDYAFKKYYSNPVVLWKNLISIRSWQDVGRYASAARALLGI